MATLHLMSSLIKEYREARDNNRDVASILIKLAELYENEAEHFFQQDRDPFIEFCNKYSGHDYSIHEGLQDNIICEIVNECTQSKNNELNTAACRLLLSASFLLESAFQPHFIADDLLVRLFQWAEGASNPLRACATGLLVVAQRYNSDQLSVHRGKNFNLVPLMIRRLYELSNVTPQELNSGDQICNLDAMGDYEQGDTTCKELSKKRSKSRFVPILSGTRSKEKKHLKSISSTTEDLSDRVSNTELVVGSHQVFSSTPAIEQKYILKYLTSVGKYEELVEDVFEENCLEKIILRYISSRHNRDGRLAFEALRYLASLLCHKKIYLQFLDTEGLELLLEVHRPSLAAEGVSICLFALGKHQEAMKRICVGSPYRASNLVNYALWLLEYSHKSSRCYAVHFLGFGFAYEAIFQHFDQQDGLKKLFTVISTLNIFDSRNTESPRLEHRRTVKRVCKSLKRYFEAHLAAIIGEKRIIYNSQSKFTSSVSENFALSAVEHNMDILHYLFPTPLSNWEPINEFVKLNGINFLLKLVSSYFERTTDHARVKTIKAAFDILKICALTVSTGLKFCEEISPGCPKLTGIKLLLQAAEGQLIPVTEVQSSALLTIINSIYTKIPAIESSSNKDSMLEQNKDLPVEKLSHKIIEAIVLENGISTLVKIVSAKSFFTPSDSIEALACKALCGLAQSQTVIQILRKLPLISQGQLIYLMNNPVLQMCESHNYDKFCEYGLELLERVTGSPYAVDTKYFMNLNKKYMYENLTRLKEINIEEQQSEYLAQKNCARKETTENLSTAIKSPTESLLDNNDFEKSTSATFQSKNEASAFNGTSQQSSSNSSISTETIFQNDFRNAALNKNNKFWLHRLTDHSVRSIDATYACFSYNRDTRPKVIITTLVGKKVHWHAIKVFNINPYEEVARKPYRFQEISHIDSRKSSTLLATSDTGLCCSKIWNLTSKGINSIHTFKKVFHLEFGKRNINRVIGTKEEAVVIYDVNSFSELQRFPLRDLGNNYANNTSTFDFSDQLVLSDGLLFDVRSGKMLHKFDKFNSKLNGVFHPNGREIISSSEIWDIRTLKLLRTVAGLDQCRTTFNEPGTVIYAVKDTGTENNFYTFDALNYTKMSTVDAKTTVRRICCDFNDKYIATIVERPITMGLMRKKSVCRLYEVGAAKDIGDDSGEESECGTMSSSEEEDICLENDEDRESHENVENMEF